MKNEKQKKGTEQNKRKNIRFLAKFRLTQPPLALQNILNGVILEEDKFEKPKGKESQERWELWISRCRSWNKQLGVREDRHCQMSVPERGIFCSCLATLSHQ